MAKKSLFVTNPLLVIAWIAEEIYFLEKKHRVMVPLAVEEKVLKDDDHAVHVNVSVDALSIFIRAAKDAGMINNRNVTSLLKVVAKFFRTPHIGSISPESLRVKYYEPENRSIETIENMLHGMLKQLKKYCVIPFICWDYLNDFIELPVFDVF